MKRKYCGELFNKYSAIVIKEVIVVSDQQDLVMEFCIKQLLLVCVLCTRVIESKQCQTGFQPCGEVSCCCSKKLARANCIGQYHPLHYIPRLPSYVKELFFNHNPLPRVTRDTFINVTFLNCTWLTLIANRIKNISEDAFTDLSYLQQLDLDNNNNINLTSIAESFQSLQDENSMILSLKNITFNNISDTFFHALKRKHRTTIDISLNVMNDLNLDLFRLIPYSWKLVASECRIAIVHVQTSNLSLEHLDLRNNRIMSENFKICSGSSDSQTSLPYLRHLVLRSNLLVKSDKNMWRCLPELEYLDLRENFIYHFESNAYANLENLVTLDLSYMYKPSITMAASALNNSNLQKIHLDGNGINFRCQLENIFSRCTNLTVVTLSENDFSSMSGSSIITMFSHVRSLRRLVLQKGNFVLPEKLISLLPNLTSLDLDYNSISSIGESFKFTNSLRRVSFQGNKIRLMKQKEFDGNSLGSIQYLNLANNPFECTCDLLWFRKAINNGSIGGITLQNWPNLYICATPTSKGGTLLLDFNPTDFSCQNILLISLISLGSVVLIVSIAAPLICKYRLYIAYWVYKMRTKRAVGKNTPLLNDECTANNVGTTYDGFIIYTPSDEDFVHGPFRLLLEESFSYRMHIWDRDVTAGQARLEAMVDAIYASNNAIAVVSADSLNDKWFQFQITVAMDRQVDLERDFLMFAILDNVQHKQLSKFWCVMFTKLPSAHWCFDEDDIKRKTFDQQLKHHFGRPFDPSVQ